MFRVEWADEGIASSGQRVYGGALLEGNLSRALRLAHRVAHVRNADTRDHLRVAQGRRRTGQMVEDVRLALNGRVPVEFYGRVGGNVPSSEEIYGELFARMSAAVV